MKLPLFLALAILLSSTSGVAKPVAGDESEAPKLAPKKARVVKIEAIDEDEIGNLEDQLNVIDNKIVVTKKEISRIRDATYLPDLYFALADMYTQKSRVMYILKTQKNVGKDPETLDFTGEKRPKQEAIDIYQKIYNFFPKEKRRDKALFLQGLEQRDLGMFEEMIRTFNGLSKEFPTSEHYNEANIILGDYLFEQKKDIAAAIEVYKKVASRPLSAFTPLAQYRIGWCYMNELKYEDAVKAYEDALSTQSQTNPDELPEMYRKTDIRREAVFALAVPYVELYTDPEKKHPNLPPPVDYFKQKSPDHFTYRRVLSRAGRRLILKERWKDAADTFFNVVVLSTDFDTRLEALQRVNEANKRKESHVDFLPFIREIAITIDLLQAQLERPIVLDANAIKGLDSKRQISKKRAELNPVNQLQFLETLMRDFATKLHARARASGSPVDFDQASEAYQTYLDRFPKAPKALDMEYNLAEALFKGDHPVRAGMQYEVLSKDKRLAKRTNMFKESAIESYTKALQIADQLSPVERIRARRGMRAVGASWLKDNSNAPGAPTAAFNIANSWYEERNLKKAIETFKDFIKKYPKDARVRDAIFLTINSHSQMDDYKGLQVSGEQLIKTAGLSEADKNTIRDAVRRAQTKQLQAVAGDFGSKEYAQNLLSVASKYKDSALGVEALHEAFLSLRGKNDPELFDVGEALLDRHADSQYAKEVSSSMATLALTTASFDRAARYLSRFATKYPNEKESIEFRKTAAVLFERQADFKRAREIYASLGNKAAVTRMDLQLSDWPRLEKSSLESGLRQGAYWHALAVWRQRRYQDAVPLLRALADNHSVSPDQSGHAKFLLSQLSLERFRGIQMKSAEDQKALLEKVNAFKSLSSELQKLVQGSAGRWPIAALYLLGQTHYDLGRFIADSPLPAGLSEADKKTYIGELKKQAGVYITESEKVFAKCIEAAQANDVFTRYVDGCRGKGQKAIREEDDLAKTPPKAAGAEPRDARTLRKQLFQKPSDINLLFSLGDTYIRADQPQTAAGIFASILEKDANSARAIASIGVAALYTNEFDSAYDSFKKALEIDPKNPTALWNLAGLYKQFGFKAKLSSLTAKMSGITRPKLVHPFAKGL
jgi:tetratricopeptide (TPR) repeat protein